MTANVFLDPDSLGRMAARGLERDVLIYEGACTKATERFPTVPLEAIQERVTTDETFEALDWSAKLLIRHLKDIFKKELWPLQRKSDKRELQVPVQDRGGAYEGQGGRQEQDWSFELPMPLRFSGNFYQVLKDSFGKYGRIPDKASVFEALDGSMKRKGFSARELKITDTVSVYEIKGGGLETKILRGLRDYLILSEEKKHPGYRAFVSFLEREKDLLPGVVTRDGRSSFYLPAPPGIAEGAFSAELVSDIEQENALSQLEKNILLRRLGVITRPARTFELSKRVELNEISLPLKSQRRQAEVRRAFINALENADPGYEGFAYWVDSVLQGESSQGEASPGEVTLDDVPLEQAPAADDDEDRTKLLVGTYNVCWDCMEGLTEPGHRSSAAVLASRCTRATTQSDARYSVCLTQLARNIDANFQGAHFMALQESSLWRILQAKSAVLQGMDSLSHSSGSSASSDVITLFYNRAFRPLWVGKGSVTWLSREGRNPRPLIVALFQDRTSGRRLIVLTLHNIHVRTAADRILAIQQAVRKVPELVERLRPFPEDTLLICLGDWNDRDEGLNGFSPFGLCEQLPLQNTRVSAEGALPLSCCSTKDPPDRMSFPGDYTLSNYPTKNAVVAFPHGPIASDHFPVRATITLPPAGGEGRAAPSPRSLSLESGEVQEDEA